MMQFGNVKTDGDVSFEFNSGAMKMSTSDASYTRIEDGGDLLEVFNADIKGRLVEGGEVKLNGNTVAPDAEGVVDLGQLDSPIGQKFATLSLETN